MKLSMWMIANRLQDLEPELHISPDAPAILNSGRTVYATNCVYCYQDGDSVVCKGEDDYIVLHDITLIQAFEIIQSVFDFYEDWLAAITSKIEEGAYQEFVDLLWSVIHNPIVLLDSDHHVLAMTRQYPEGSIDEEWDYVLNYQAVSLKSMRTRAKYNDSGMYDTRKFLKDNAYDRLFLNRSIISYSMGNSGDICGKLVVINHERECNPGDIHILQSIVRILEYSLIQKSSKEDAAHSNVFLDLLLDRPYHEKRLNRHMDYTGWKMDDIYSVISIRTDRKVTGQRMSTELKTLHHLLENNAEGCMLLKSSETAELLILQNRDCHENTSLLALLEKLCRMNPIQIGFSLHLRGLTSLHQLYEQAKAAIYLGNLNQTDGQMFNFQDFAIDHIIMNGSIEKSIFSCMPAICDLWFKGHTSENELYDTLKCFLQQNASVVATAKAMFTHRNTIQYRMKKIFELLNCTPEDSYAMEYCRISVRVIELYEKKYGAQSLIEELHFR